MVQSKPIDTTTKIAIFRKKEIRRTIYKNEWWFSVIDVVAALTDSLDPNDYWYRMKIRVKDEEKIELSTICRQLKLESTDDKKAGYQSSRATQKQAAILPVARERNWKSVLNDRWCQRKIFCLVGRQA